MERGEISTHSPLAQVDTANLEGCAARDSPQAAVVRMRVNQCKFLTSMVGETRCPSNRERRQVLYCTSGGVSGLPTDFLTHMAGQKKNQNNPYYNNNNK